MLLNIVATNLILISISQQTKISGGSFINPLSFYFI